MLRLPRVDVSVVVCEDANVVPKTLVVTWSRAQLIEDDDHACRATLQLTAEAKMGWVPKLAFDAADVTDDEFEAVPICTLRGRVVDVVSDDVAGVKE